MKRRLLRVTGQLLKVTGQLLKVTGQLLKVTGRLLKVTGQLLRFTDRLLKVTGQLLKVTGRLLKVTSRLLRPKRRLLWPPVAPHIQHEPCTKARRAGAKLAGSVSHRMLIQHINRPGGASESRTLTNNTAHRSPRRCVSEAQGILPEMSAADEDPPAWRCRRERHPATKR